MLVLSRALIRLGVGLLFVGPYTMAVRWFEKANGIGVAMGVMFTSDGIGTVFALYLFSFVLIAFDWRHGSATGAIFLLMVLVLTLLFLKEPPHVTKGKNEQNQGKLAFSDYLSVIKNRNVFVATAFFVGEWGLYAVIAYWVPTILIEEAGWSEGLAGFFTSLYVLIGVIPSIVFGLMSDKLGRRRPFIISAGLWMTISVTALTLALYYQRYDLVALFMPLVGLGVYTGMPVSLALATESVGSKGVAIANGFILGTGFLLGGFLYPFIMGYIKDLTGTYTIGFVGAIAATLILNFLVGFIGKDTVQNRAVNKGEAV